MDISEVLKKNEPVMKRLFLKVTATRNLRVIVVLYAVLLVLVLAAFFAIGGLENSPTNDAEEHTAQQSLDAKAEQHDSEVAGVGGAPKGRANGAALLTSPTRPPWVLAPVGPRTNGSTPREEQLPTGSQAVAGKTRSTRPKIALWPEDAVGEDRIEDQLAFELPEDAGEPPLLTILSYAGMEAWMKSGRQSFIEQGCKVNHCSLTADKRAMATADAVFFRHSQPPAKRRQPDHQVYVVYMLESALNMAAGAGVFSYLRGTNYWMATYRHDSELVAPYERFRLYNSSVTALPLRKDYSLGKSKMAAIFVSNCGASNGRLQYVKELQKYIDVDVYGGCGPLKCPRRHMLTCYEKLKDYRFYLAFENSNCRDYISEKFFVTGLQHDLVPVAMGGHPEDYRRHAPYNSHIHADDFPSARELAAYLSYLAANATAYNEYFRWKGTGDFINTKFYCRLCALLHAARSPQWRRSPRPSAGDPSSWWNGHGVCRRTPWSQRGGFSVRDNPDIPYF